jgi:hypothetical protein
MPLPPPPVPRQPNFGEDISEAFKTLKKGKKTAEKYIPKHKPPRKRSNAFKAKKMAEAEETGRLNAERKHERKKSLTERVFGYFETLLLNINPVEALAILGGTVIVHEIIFQLKDFALDLQKVNPVALGTATFGGALAGGPLLALIDAWAQTQFAEATATQEQKDEWAKLRKNINEDMVFQLTTWLIAFTISYIAIKHGDDLLTAAKGAFGMLSVV